MIILAVCIAVASFIINYLFKIVSRKLIAFLIDFIITRIRSKYFRSIMNQEIKWFDQIDSKTLGSRIIGISQVI